MNTLTWLAGLVDLDGSPKETRTRPRNLLRASKLSFTGTTVRRPGACAS